MRYANSGKETASLEAKAFELDQKTALANEAKQVLDSWVRYEGQVKQRQQRELADSVVARITKELENPKTLQQILQQSVADVESRFPITLLSRLWELIAQRNCGIEVSIEFVQNVSSSLFKLVVVSIRCSCRNIQEVDI